VWSYERQLVAIIQNQITRLIPGSCMSPLVVRRDVTSQCQRHAVLGETPGCGQTGASLKAAQYVSRRAGGTNQGALLDKGPAVLPGD
jgi:hypothetical protein